MKDVVLPSEADIRRWHRFGRVLQPLTLREWLKVAERWDWVKKHEICGTFAWIAADNRDYANERAEKMLGLERLG